MKSMPIEAFLSCSFDPKDRDVVDFFACICRGLDINCINVDKGYALTPPEKARELIGNAHALVAIATRREEWKDGVFKMPIAVNQEMSMAYANGKKILLFAENGVDTESGFTRNYTTYLEFDRASLLSPMFLEKAIASIHGLKMDVISPEELNLVQQSQQHVFAEFVGTLIELIDQSGSFTWRYTTTRRLRFTSRFNDPIKAGCWTSVPNTKATQSDIIKFSYSLDYGTKPFCFRQKDEKHDHEHCYFSFDIEPKPEKDDVIEYTTVFESQYLNPVYLEDVRDPHPEVTNNGVNYVCFDGIVPIIRTKDLKILFRFPASLGLKPEHFVPFVGSYTNKVDYLVESEKDRIAINLQNFGGNVFIEMSIQSPLLHHFYGVAWNPPKRPSPQ